jgi:hypothetical protein
VPAVPRSPAGGTEHVVLCAAVAVAAGTKRMGHIHIAVITTELKLFVIRFDVTS